MMLKKYSELFLYFFFIFTLLSCGSEGKIEEDIIPPPQEEEEQDPPVEDKYFTNPVWSRGADPWVSQEDGKYYFTYTAGGSLTVYEIERISDYFEGDNFKQHSIWRPPTGTMYSHNLWAPELHKINGKWYAYLAADDGVNRNHRMYVLEYSGSSLSRGGDWVLKGKLTDPTDFWAIDGTILEYNDELYTIWSGWVSTTDTRDQNLYIAKMSDPWTIKGERYLISTPEYYWEMNGTAPTNEGPAMIKNANGDVFMTFSGSRYGSDNYCIGLMQLKPGGDPLKRSDWIKYDEPILTRNDEGGVFGPGHNGFFKSPDGTEDWIVYHARNSPDGGSTNFRNTRIQKVLWDDEGKPYFEEAVPIGEEIERPSGE